MLIRVFSILMLFITMGVHAQIIVGIPNNITTKGEEIDSRTMRAFENSTTVFFYPEKDAEHYEKYAEVIGKDWKITPLIFAPMTDAKKYISRKGEYSYLMYNMMTRIKEAEYGSPYVSALWIYLDLVMPSKDGTNTILAKIVLGPHVKDMAYIGKNYFQDITIKEKFFKKDEWHGVDGDVERTGNYLYSTAVYTNMYPGVLKFYLKEVSDKLIIGETLGILEKVENNRLAELSTKKLIVPAEMLDEYKRFKDEVVKREEADFFKKYDFEYEVLPIATINEMLLKEEFPSDAFLLVPALSNTDKYIVIYDGNGEKIYKKFSVFEGEFDKKDLKKISKEVEKAQG